VLSAETDAGTALRGGRAMLKLGLRRIERDHDEAFVQSYYPVLLKAYAQAICEHTVLYPRAMEAVEQLKTRGYGVGIATNKPEALAHQLLSELGVLNDFASLVGADTLPVRKPDPEHLFEAARRAGGDPKQCVLVGDTDTDRNTAKAAGVPSVLVTFGPGGGDMAALEPEALLEDYAHLPDMVETLIGRNGDAT